MKNRGNNNHSIAGAFIFLLLGIFAVFGTVMVLMGVKAYRSTDEQTNTHNEYRVLSSYVRSMSRTEDGYGEFRVEEVGGVQTLTIEEGTAAVADIHHIPKAAVAAETEDNIIYPRADNAAEKTHQHNIDQGIHLHVKGLGASPSVKHRKDEARHYQQSVPVNIQSEKTERNAVNVKFQS